MKAIIVSREKDILLKVLYNISMTTMPYNTKGVDLPPKLNNLPSLTKYTPCHTYYGNVATYRAVGNLNSVKSDNGTRSDIYFHTLCVLFSIWCISSEKLLAFNLTRTKGILLSHNGKVSIRVDRSNGSPLRLLTNLFILTIT